MLVRHRERRVLAHGAKEEECKTTPKDLTLSGARREWI